MKSLVDVGGGTGTVAKAIGNAFPKINCIVFDLPHVIEGCEGSKNLSYVGGDMFKSIPSADAILLKWILHNWSDEECIKILKKCKEAIPKRENGGTLIIIDMVLMDSQKGDDKSYETQLFYDMLMMVDASGKQRIEQEWAKLFLDAGFTDYEIIPILGLRSVIEVYP
ncbi:putative bidirectional sugar transporter SWEET14-like [Capsicum annuum]|nr:putative bidirectional sugar transporter SWEET14-like [Capsicum annuum]